LNKNFEQLIKLSVLKFLQYTFTFTEVFEINFVLSSKSINSANRYHWLALSDAISCSLELKSVSAGDSGDYNWWKGVLQSQLQL